MRCFGCSCFCRVGRQVFSWPARSWNWKSKWFSRSKSLQPEEVLRSMPRVNKKRRRRQKQGVYFRTHMTDCGCCTIVSHVHVILCGSVVGEKSKANQALKGAANSVVKVLPKESNGNVIISRGILTRKLNGWHWQTTTQSNPLVGLSTRSVTGMYLRVLWETWDSDRRRALQRTITSLSPFNTAKPRSMTCGRIVSRVWCNEFQQEEKDWDACMISRTQKKNASVPSCGGTKISIARHT